MRILQTILDVKCMRFCLAGYANACHVFHGWCGFALHRIFSVPKMSKRKILHLEKRKKKKTCTLAKTSKKYAKDNEKMGAFMHIWFIIFVAIRLILMLHNCSFSVFAYSLSG